MKTILFVEGDDAIRTEVAEMLAVANYHVLTAKNGKEGVEAAKNHLPDVIMSAMTMPILDGLGMLYVLRHDPSTESIPVIFLTTRTDRSDFRMAMDSGADDFITRPFTDDELLKAIENRLGRLDAIRRKNTSDLQQLHEHVSGEHTEPAERLSVTRDMQMYQRKPILAPEEYAPHSLYFLCNDKVKTYKTYEDGKQLIIALYNDGNFLGNIALLAESTYKHLARTINTAALNTHFQ